MKEIGVFAGWKEEPQIIGTCSVDNARGKEVISFSYSLEWLDLHPGFFLDPDIFPMEGRQFPPDGKPCFGFLADTAPDRWGRTLIDRRERMEASVENRAPRRLMESDYIFGVHDKGRIGGIRYFDRSRNTYISDRDTLAAPPMEKLRLLESASLSIENNDKDADKWLKNLIDPGSSLGGARPKSNVIDEEGHMWIAKFPSRRDSINVGAWEMVAHELAVMCEINVPEAKIMRFSDAGDTFLVKRFDRKKDRRIHYASAMTMLDQTDNSEEQMSYLDIAGTIEQICEEPERDLHELWKRMIFNICISNTDDHLRNHGFLLCGDNWSLSPAFDINPDIEKDRLSLYIGDNDKKDLSEAIRVADYFRIDKDKAEETADKIKQIINTSWRMLADKYHIPRNEQELMSRAFAI